MAQTQIFSADSHTMEPANLWTQRMDNKWRDRAPRVITNYEGKKGSVFVAEGLTPFPVGGGFAAGKDPKDLAATHGEGRVAEGFFPGHDRSISCDALCERLLRSPYGPIFRRSCSRGLIPPPHAQLTNYATPRVFALRRSNARLNHDPEVRALVRRHARVT